MSIRLLLPVAALFLTFGCEQTLPPASPTTVTTTITLPQSPTPVTSTPPQSCAPTATCATPCAPTASCTGVGTSPRAPEVLFFNADSGRIHKGAATILRWEISDPTAQVRIDPGIGSVGAVGFVLVFPTQTTTYTLTARNSIATVQRQFTVVVSEA